MFCGQGKTKMVPEKSWKVQIILWGPPPTRNAQTAAAKWLTRFIWKVISFIHCWNIDKEKLFFYEMCVTLRSCLGVILRYYSGRMLPSAEVYMIAGQTGHHVYADALRGMFVYTYLRDCHLKCQVQTDIILRHWALSWRLLELTKIGNCILACKIILGM